MLKGGIAVALTAEQKASYERDGFLIYGPILTPEELGLLRERIDALASGEGDEAQNVRVRLEAEAQQGGLQEVSRRDQVFQILGATRADPVIFRHAANPKILDIVQELLESSDIKFYADQTIMKPAYHGSPVSWHQDSAYWTNVEPPGLVSCWVALDDVTLENGCMMMIPGSHKLGLIEHRRDTFLHAQGLDLSKAVPVLMKAGSCSFHHSLTVHGSGSNQTPYRRRGLVTSYMRADTKWVGDPEKNPQFPLLRGREYPGCV
jgi:ectoine hydroxylase-related dioxygenase (phytanoyl-CoA dioxygenase family)